MRFKPVLGVLLWLGAICYALFAIDRSALIQVLATTVSFSLGWWMLYTSIDRKLGIGLGVGIRLLAVFAFPVLSDDIYRFLWDGELWLSGYHPLDFLPAQAPESFRLQHEALLENMNSPGYYTVYPPGSQLIYIFGAVFNPSVFTGTVAIKLLLLVAELTILWKLIQVPNLKDSHLLSYWLHPLPIIEVLGNAHLEGLTACFLLLALLYHIKSPLKSGVGLAFAAMTKLVPFLAGPAFLFSMLKMRKWSASVHWLLALFGVSALALAAFFFGVDLSGFTNSLDLYFRSFEFNGAIYNLAKPIGEWYRGWNWIAVIGPGLGISAVVLIISMAGWGAVKNIPLAEIVLWSFFIWMMFSTTVHPWYSIYILVLAPLTRYYWPYVLGLSLFLSYTAYSTATIEVPYLILGVEWLAPLAVAIVEVWKPKRLQRFWLRQQ